MTFLIRTTRGRKGHPTRSGRGRLAWLSGQTTTISALVLSVLRTLAFSNFPGPTARLSEAIPLTILLVKCQEKIFRCAVGAVILTLCVCAVGCTPKIPTRVTVEELNLYHEWLKHYFASKPPVQLYLDDQTFIYDPLDKQRGQALPKGSGISSSLGKQLHALGNAEYPVEVASVGLNLPWPYKVLNPRELPAPATGLHIISFSRVAFNRSNTEALFAISDSCGGDCGHGGPVHAVKQNGSWQFTEFRGWVF